MTWRKKAACAGWPTAWWFAGDSDPNRAKALAICKRCPVKAECRMDAIRNGDSGIRGGAGGRAQGVCAYCGGEFYGGPRRKFCGVDCRDLALDRDPLAVCGGGRYSAGCRCRACMTRERDRQRAYRARTAS